MSRRPIVILLKLAVCAKCGDYLYFDDRDSSIFHFTTLPPKPRCDWEGMRFPEATLNAALWTFLSERFVLSEAQKESITRLALSKAVGAIELDPDQAKERLGAVVNMMREYADKDPREVNAALRGLFEKIEVSQDGSMRYVPRAWCASLFTTPS